MSISKKQNDAIMATAAKLAVEIIEAADEIETKGKDPRPIAMSIAIRVSAALIFAADVKNPEGAFELFNKQMRSAYRHIEELQAKVMAEK